MCTVYSVDGTIYWRRGDLFIVMDGRPIGNDKSLYNVTAYTNNTAKQERLRVSTELAVSSINKRANFWCENQGYSSLNIFFNIPGKDLRLKSFRLNQY